MGPTRAIGLVRVSQPKGREGESFSSPKDQRDRILAFVAERGWELVEVFDELEVSGDALLENRPGLSQAVTAVLTGAADAIVAAHTERLWWNHEVRGQVLRLVESAAGEVWSCDEGRLSNSTAADEFSGSVRTAADRFSRKQNAEKSRAAVVRAVARGVIPFPNVPPPLRVGADGRAEVVAEEVKTVREAVRMRADGATVNAIRAYLSAHGIRRSYHGVAHMLSSPLLIGQIRFGGLENLAAFDPVVDVELWRRAQRVRGIPGRRPKSDRLLARLGVLRCGTCGARMVVGSANHGGYPLYRCPPNGDCPRRVTISAALAEGLVVDAVKAALADVRGRASAAGEAQAAELEAERAQQDLDAAIRAFAGLEEEASARERLAELREHRDAARVRAEELRGTRSALSVSVDDWDRLSLDARRGLVRAVVARVVVASGRGTGRVRVELVGE